MARSPERRESSQPPAAGTASAVGADAATKPTQPTSPVGSDKSSDSEGRQVRKNLKETSLDAQPSSDSAQQLNDAPNGTDVANDPSTSGSESGRGRLRRKRSREDFEDETDKPQGKKVHEHHARKKSRDITSPHGSNEEIQTTANPKSSVTRIDEQEGQDGDENMANSGDPREPEHSASDRPSTPTASAKDVAEIVSPKNKRTLDQSKSSDSATFDGTKPSTNTDSDALKTDEGRDAKRPRDTNVVSETNATVSKIPPGSGFANTSTTSPFSALSPQSQNPASGQVDGSKEAKSPPQTSDAKFKASGFGSFASSNASPFGGVAQSASPFGASTGGNKLSSFASSANTTKTTGSAFGSLGAAPSTTGLGGNSTSTKGNSVFGGSLGASAFGGLGGAKSGLQSFATPGAQTITGLKQKTARPFGAQPEDQSEDEDEEDDSKDDDESVADSDKAKQVPEQEKRPTFQPTEVETGEEGEEARWVGRAKLYTFTKEGEGANKGWHERGAGSFKLNITKEPPSRARFVLRADGTHRLLLNAALTPNLTFGDANGNKPSDGRVIFNAPTADGNLEMHLIRMKAERAAELWDNVERIKSLLS